MAANSDSGGKEVSRFANTPTRSVLKVHSRTGSFMAIDVQDFEIDARRFSALVP
jgi:hypothetical protein